MTTYETGAKCPHCVVAGRDGQVIVTIEQARNFDHPAVLGPGGKNSFYTKISHIACNNPDCCSIFTAVPGMPEKVVEIFRKHTGGDQRTNALSDAATSMIADIVEKVTKAGVTRNDPGNLRAHIAQSNL